MPATAASGTPATAAACTPPGATRVDIYGGLIEGNTAANEGGGLWNSAQGLMILHFGTAIRNNIAVGDDLRDGGGGLFNDGGRLAIAEAEISGNSAVGPDSTGGGLLSVAGVVTIENSTFSGNTANNAGGGIANFGDADLHQQHDRQERQQPGRNTNSTAAASSPNSADRHRCGTRSSPATCRGREPADDRSPAIWAAPATSAPRLTA